MNKDDAVGTALTWPQVWLAAVARPTVSTHQELAKQPRVGSWDGWIWLAGSSFLSGLLVSVGPILAHARPASDLGLPLAAFVILAVFAWVIFIVCVQQTARLLRGEGTHPALVYSFAAFSAPLMLLASGLSLVPHSRPGLVLLYLYWLILYSVAVQAAHRLSWVKAVGSVLLSLILLSGVLLGFGFVTVAWKL